MNSKDYIITNIKKENLTKTNLPEIPEFRVTFDKISKFKKSREENHVNVVDCKDENILKKIINKEIINYAQVVSTIPGLNDSFIHPDSINKNALNNIDAAIIQAEFGVSENGALWIPEENMIYRAIPFIVTHFIIVLNIDNIVLNMNEAYRRIKKIPGFGLFVAGPSKTADIEQSLVIGAHGPKSMTVITTSF